MSRLLVLLRSKTVWGAVCAAGGWLAQQPKLGVAEYVQAVGMVLTAAGVRDAIEQAMKGGTAP
jgi:hypothetical protein